MMGICLRTASVSPRRGGLCVRPQWALKIFRVLCIYLGKEPGHETLNTKIDVGLNEAKCVVYPAVFGRELQLYIVFSQNMRYNG